MVLKVTPFSKKPRNKKSLNESLTWLLSNFLIVLTIVRVFFSGVGLDCKTVGFFVKISKEIGKAWRKSLMRAKGASLTRPSPVSLSVFSLVSRPFV